MKGHKSYRTFDPDFPLITLRCHRKRVLPNFINYHWHSHFELIYVAQGSLEVYDPDGNYMAREGTLCIFPVGRCHCVRSTESPTEFWNIHISPDLLQMGENHFFQKEFTQPMRTCSLHTPTHLNAEQMPQRILSALHTVMFSHQRWERFLGVMEICLQLLPLCSHDPNPQTLPGGNLLVRECLRYIHTNYTAELTLEELAAHVHLHPNYLCALFKKDMGQSVFDYIAYHRVNVSLKLLEQTQLSIAQIAEQVGFNNPDYFTRKFKELVGVTPSAFQKNRYS